MSAPTLFVLAADLTKMQVLASLDESDVGRIRPGQLVRFRVDAFPTDEFTGNVTQVRLQPTTVQNVVTYQTVIDVPNPGLKLKPGMTANVNIEIARRADVLRVPNTACGSGPTAEIFAALGQTPPPGGVRRRTRTWRRRRPRHTQYTEPQLRHRRHRRLPPLSRHRRERPATAARHGPHSHAKHPNRSLPRRAERLPPHRWAAATVPGAGASGRGNFAERMASMTPEERERFMERMRARGFTPPAEGQAAATSARGGRGQGPRTQGADGRRAHPLQPDPSRNRHDVRRAVWTAHADRIVRPGLAE